MAYDSSQGNEVVGFPLLQLSCLPQVESVGNTLESISVEVSGISCGLYLSFFIVDQCVNARLDH